MTDHRLILGKLYAELPRWRKPKNACKLDDLPVAIHTLRSYTKLSDKKHFIMNLEYSTSRRAFIKSTSTAAFLGAVAAPYVLTSQAAPDDVLKVGLVGCGGRGSGAAKQALNADKNVQLVAMGDVFDERLKSSLASLKADAEVSAKVNVTPEKCFIGLDAYQKVINSGVDVVLLATPPGFRPLHLKASIEAGKHTFAEKPMATAACILSSRVIWSAYSTEPSSWITWT